jgi:hypothetical protein
MTDNEKVFPEGTKLQEAQVTYTTKELLQRIDHRFDRLEILAEGAATRTEVEALGKRVSALEQDASGTKAVAKALLESGKDRWSRNEKIAGLALGIIAVTPSIGLVINLFH